MKKSGQSALRRVFPIRRRYGWDECIRSRWIRSAGNVGIFQRASEQTESEYGFVGAVVPESTLCVPTHQETNGIPLSAARSMVQSCKSTKTPQDRLP